MQFGHHNIRKDTKLSESILKNNIKMEKGLEGKTDEEQ